MWNVRIGFSLHKRYFNSLCFEEIVSISVIFLQVWHIKLVTFFVKQTLDKPYTNLLRQENSFEELAKCGKSFQIVTFDFQK